MKSFRILSQIIPVGLTAGLFLIGSTHPAQAQLLWTEDFHGYQGADPDGAYPRSGLTLDGSTLYGTTESGGADGAGTVFSLPVTGGAPTTISSFSFSGMYGPTGAMSIVGSTLYGTASSGGAFFNGAVFSVPTSGGTLTPVSSFNDTNGSTPHTSLTISGSTIYGTTQYGGGGNGNGTVFSTPLAGGTPTALATFGGTTGYNPSSGLVLSGSKFYGVTAYGGDVVHQAGVVYSVPVGGGTPTAVVTFKGTNGSNPYADMILVGTKLYGTTTSGGAGGSGTVFSVSTVNGALTTLATFNDENGASPYGKLATDGTTLYGTTQGGGDSGFGTLFSLPIAGGAPTTLLSFNGTNGSGANDLLLSGTILYGTTSNGGVEGNGNVFAFQTAAVPEPSNWALLGGSFLLLLIRQLRLKKDPSRLRGGVFHSGGGIGESFPHTLSN